MRDGERRVVVTGMGALTPVGNSVPDFWDGLVNGRSGIGPITMFDPAKTASKIGGEISQFSPNPDSSVVAWPVMTLPSSAIPERAMSSRLVPKARASGDSGSGRTLMKRTLIAATALALAGTLTGCGGDDEPSSITVPDDTTTTERPTTTTTTDPDAEIYE